MRRPLGFRTALIGWGLRAFTTKGWFTVTTATEALRGARDFLLKHRDDYDTAYEQFVWPRPEEFNFALDWFDAALTDHRG